MASPWRADSSQELRMAMTLLIMAVGTHILAARLLTLITKPLLAKEVTSGYNPKVS
jgi:hypothetical protein